MIKNTNADPDRIGSSGISYGGGISLLAAAFDSRIKSVVSMSCWIDLEQSLLGQGNTIRSEAVKELKLLAELTGTTSEDVEYLFDNYLQNQNLDKIKSLVYDSSPINFMDQLKKNNPSIFIANAFGDSIFTPNQFPSFFEGYTGPKHMEFSPGDHIGPELSGIFPQKTNLTKLFGVPGLVWERAEMWFDYYLKTTGNFGTAYTPEEDMPPVIFNTITTNNTLDTYKQWSDVSKNSMRFSFGSRERLEVKRSSPSDAKDFKAGVVQDDAVETSLFNTVATITTGWSTINGGVAVVTNTVASIADHARPWYLNDIDRKYAAVFVTDKNDLKGVTQFVRGIPTLSLVLEPPKESGSFIVYVLDCGEHEDVGQIITFAPYTYSGVKAGKTVTINMEITMTSWNIAAGHRLGVVVGTKDKLFYDLNTPNQSVKISDESVLFLPLK